MYYSCRRVFLFVSLDLFHVIIANNCGSIYVRKWAVVNYLCPPNIVVMFHVRPTSVLFGADYETIDEILEFHDKSLSKKWKIILTFY